MHSNRNTVNQKDQDSVDTTMVMVTETGVQAGGDIEDDEVERPNLLQVTEDIIVLTDSRCGAPEESVGASRPLEMTTPLGFTLLASRATGEGNKNVFETCARKRDLPEAPITEVLALKTTWSIEMLAAPTKQQSAGTMSPILNEIVFLGTRSADSIQLSSCLTLALGAREGMRTSTALLVVCYS